MVVETLPNRHLALEGTHNVRDIGGYATRDSRETRWRTVYRSDSLHRLSAAAQADLIAYGLRTVIDLRHSQETADMPNVFAQSERVRYLNLPLFEASTSQPPSGAGGATPGERP